MKFVNAEVILPGAGNVELAWMEACCQATCRTSATLIIKAPSAMIVSTSPVSAGSRTRTKENKGTVYLTASLSNNNLTSII